MPTLDRDDVRIHYAESGDPDGPAVLLIAPGGMRSSMERWGGRPWDPRTDLPAFRVVAMDQRNAGRSRGPVLPGSGWDTYTADQLALMDHLGIERFHVIGMCIGGAYIMGLARAAPDRVRSAVMLQPIGLHDNRTAFLDMFDGWVAAIRADHPEATDTVWADFARAMFGGEFLFNATRAQAAATATPILLFMGDDLYHPEPVSRELASILPNVTFVERWKDRPEATGRTIRSFLAG